jgi:DNA (cytosine-5)-methyltransferase 1
MQPIAGWLAKLGMSEYAERFEANQIDVIVLPDLTDGISKSSGVAWRSSKDPPRHPELEVFRLLNRRRVPLGRSRERLLHVAVGQGKRDANPHRGVRGALGLPCRKQLAFLPQRRERVLFVATTTEVDPASVLLTDEVEPCLAPTNLDAYAHGFYWTEGIRGLGWAPDSIPTLKNGSTVGIPSPPAILFPSGDVITPDVQDAERLQGFREN